MFGIWSYLLNSVIIKLKSKNSIDISYRPTFIINAEVHCRVLSFIAN